MLLCSPQVSGAQLGTGSVVYQLKDGSRLTARIPRAPTELISLLDSKHVPFAQGRATAGQLLLPYIGLLVYLGVVGFFGWQMMGKGIGGGSAGKRVQAGALDRSLGLDDVAGIDKAKQQVLCHLQPPHCAVAALVCECAFSFLQAWPCLFALVVSEGAFSLSQVMQVIDVMKNPSKYKRLGARQPSGLLLVGNCFTIR